MSRRGVGRPVASVCHSLGVCVSLGGVSVKGLLDCMVDDMNKSEKHEICTAGVRSTKRRRTALRALLYTQSAVRSPLVGADYGAEAREYSHGSTLQRMTNGGAQDDAEA